MVKDTSI